MDWQLLKLPLAERRLGQRDSSKFFERSVDSEVWKDWMLQVLKKELATLSKELPPVESLPAKRKEQSPDPTKRDASREEFRVGRRVLAGGARNRVRIQQRGMQAQRSSESDEEC